MLSSSRSVYGRDISVERPRGRETVGEFSFSWTPDVHAHSAPRLSRELIGLTIHTDFDRLLGRTSKSGRRRYWPCCVTMRWAQLSHNRLDAHGVAPQPSCRDLDGTVARCWCCPSFWFAVHLRSRSCEFAAATDYRRTISTQRSFLSIRRRMNDCLGLEKFAEGEFAPFPTITGHFVSAERSFGIL